MRPAQASRPEGQQEVTDRVEQLGAWLFRHRTSLPLPVAVALILMPPGKRLPSPFSGLGPALVIGGELVRLWAVRHIGVISRTRSDRLGPLVTTGPFAWVRNPLYLANIALWAGFALTARLPWLVPVVVVFLGIEYHAIVRWEERLIAARHGADYHAYAARVPRWLPRVTLSCGTTGDGTSASRYSWRDTFFSERGTILAIAAGFVLLWVKSLV